MKRVFVDTGGFFALPVDEDSAHDRATALFEQAEQEADTALELPVARDLRRRTRL